MSFNTKRNIGVGALIVLIIFLVFIIQDRARLNQLEPALKAIKDKIYQSPGPIKPAAMPPVINRNQNPDLLILRKDGMVILPEKQVMANMSPEALFQTYHSYLDNTDINCDRKLRMGKMGDGGWEICDDELYRPSPDCVVYSFGINNDFSFDDEVSKIYKCSVVSFDPSMRHKSYQRSPLVYFLKMGIAGKNFTNPRNWTMGTYGFFLNKFKHTNRVIDVVKMDVEGSEWVSLPEMVKSGHLRKVKQLLMEYHGHPTDKTKLISELSILKDIYDIGFRKFYVHKNFHCTFQLKLFPIARTSCYEVHYVNVNVH